MKDDVFFTLSESYGGPCSWSLAKRGTLVSGKNSLAKEVFVRKQDPAVAWNRLGSI